MHEYLGQCDRLRRTPKGENNWQLMMEQKVPISITQFQADCDLEPLLDPDDPRDTLEEFICSDPDSGFYQSFWGSQPCMFLQTCGFEFIFVKP